MKITEQRMEELLPSNIKDSELSLATKKVLTALLDWYLNSEAKNTGIITISNKRLCAIAGVGHDVLFEAIRDIKEYGLGTRKAGEGIGNASEYILDFEALCKPLKRKTFEELFAKELKNTKSSETPIRTTVQDSTLHNITLHNITEHYSKEHNITVEISKEDNSESFIKKLEQKEGMSFANYLYKLSQEKGVNWIEETWYNENVANFNEDDLRQYRGLVGALNAKTYPIASRYNKACASAQEKNKMEIEASLVGASLDHF